MRKHVVLILMIFTIFISANAVDCVFAAENGTDIQTVSKGGVVLKFPSTWCVAKSTSNTSVVAIASIDSIGLNKVAAVTINVERKPIEGSFDDFIENNYASIEKDESFNLSSSGAVAFGDMQGKEYTYISNMNGTVKEHRAIWIDHDDEAYVILYSAPIDQFNSNLKVFDYVIKNIQINA